MRTDYELVLQIASTGKTLKQITAPRYHSGNLMNADQFKRHWVTRWCRYQNPPAGVLEAAQEDSEGNSDLIVGWSNFDALRRQGMTHSETVEILAFLQL